MYDLLLKNGIVVNENLEKKLDVAIKDGKISALGECGELKEAKNIIDLEGKYVIPGLIDPHVHIKHPHKTGEAGDDFYTATVSAAFGGITSILDFGIQWDKTKSLESTMAGRIKDFNEGAVIDFGLHACPTVSSMETINEMPKLIEEGNPSFKMYMTYSKQGRMSDDGILYKALQQTHELGGIVGVHAENDAMIIFNEKEYAENGLVDPKYFPIAKSNIIEAEAINRASYINSNVHGNLYIFHLSTKEGLDIVKKAQGLGERITAETCTHYLILDSSYYERKDGANFICSPPLRSEEDKIALWDGIKDGSISIISSDHCGFGKMHKAKGNNNFLTTPNGLPGMELRLPLIYTYGVKNNRISMSKMVEVLSTNAAKTFGMYPQKGTLLPGSDADITVLDTSINRTIALENINSPIDWSPYLGFNLWGFASMTISRGEIILDKGEFKGRRGRGRFIQRRIKEQ